MPIRATSGPGDTFAAAMARKRLLANAGGSAMQGGNRVTRQDRPGTTVSERTAIVRRERTIAEQAGTPTAADRPPALDIPRKPPEATSAEPSGTGAVMRRLQSERTVRSVAELRQEQARERVEESRKSRETMATTTLQLRREASRGILDRMTG